MLARDCHFWFPLRSFKLAGRSPGVYLVPRVCCCGKLLVLFVVGFVFSFVLFAGCRRPLGPARGAFDKRRAALRFSQYLRNLKPVSGFSTALRSSRRSVLQKRRLFPPGEGPSIRAAVHLLHAGVVVSCGAAYSRSNVPRCVRLCPVCKGSFGPVARATSFTWCAAISARSLNRSLNQDWGTVMAKVPLRVAKHAWFCVRSQGCG